MTDSDESPPLRESKSEELSEIILNMKVSGKIPRLEAWIMQTVRERMQEEFEQLRARIWENLFMDSQTIHKRDIPQPAMDLIKKEELDSIFNRPAFFRGLGISSIGLGLSVFKSHDLWVPPIVIPAPEDIE